MKKQPETIDTIFSGIFISEHGERGNTPLGHLDPDQILEVRNQVLDEVLATLETRHSVQDQLPPDWCTREDAQIPAEQEDSVKKLVRTSVLWHLFPGTE